MRLAASRMLARRPRNVICLPNGELLLGTFGAIRVLLEAHDRELSPTWSVHLDGEPIELLLSADGTLWALDWGGATAYGDGGARVARVAARVPDGMHVSAFARVDDDLIFACEHDSPGPMRAPVLQRVAANGEVRWFVTLPVDSIAYEGVVQIRADDGWRARAAAPWTPSSWLSMWKTLDVSGDAVLACFFDMPRSGIGMGYALSLADGALRFTTNKGPIFQAAALGGAAFLVGYQGYGAFETLRYPDDGKAPTRWASCGYYLIRGDDIRVVETGNGDLVRLLPTGAIMRGPCLDRHWRSPPCVRADGTALFFSNGTLYAARDLAIDERLELCAADDSLRCTPIVTAEESAYFAFFKTSGAEEAQLVRVDD